MKNPFQIKKKLKSSISVKNPVQIVYYDNLNNSLENVILEDKIDDLYILSRNNKDLDNIKLDNVNCKKKLVYINLKA